MKNNKNNNLVIIVKIEKYIEYMLTILLKLPRTEKFSIGTEVKTSMYGMLKNVLLASKIDRSKRLSIDQTYKVQGTKSGKWYVLNNEQRTIKLKQNQITEIHLLMNTSDTVYK